MDDLISRQAVLDKLNRLIEVERLQGTDEMGYGRERVSAYESMIFEIESEYLYPSVKSQEPCKYAISMSVIEDVKAEIGEYRDNFILANRHDLAAVAENCLMFIDKHISGKESE